MRVKIGRMGACPHEKFAPLGAIEALPESQAGVGRHKCAICAYHAGIEEGLRRAEVAIQQFRERTQPPKREPLPLHMMGLNA